MVETLAGSPYATDLSSYTFANTYGDHPWAGITTKERLFYEPLLRDMYRDQAIFGQYIQYRQNLGDRNAKTMQINGLYNTHANFDQIGLRDMWMPASHVDSRSQQITFGRYGGKVAYHVYDDIITYWKYNGGNLSAIRAIINDKLGQQMVEVQDKLARNAMLSVPYTLYANDKTSFGTLQPQDKIETGLLNEIHLGMKFRRVPYAVRTDGSVGNIVCITTPGVIYDLQNQTDPKEWLIPQAYSGATKLLNYEVGTYRNIRFVEHARTMLMNCGTVIVQAGVTTAINAGDGSPDPTTTKVDQTYMVGQPAAAHFLQLDSGIGATQMAKFHVGDWVTIHKNRTSAFGVANGVDFRDGTAEERRIVAVNVGSYQISLDQPVMLDFTTPLGGGAFAYVTRGVHIHPLIFVGGNDGIVMGVGRAPRLHTPPPVDDFDSMYRFSWDSYQGYTVFNPNVLEVAFAGGSYRFNGAMDSQG